jgi:hypothetical protein
MAKQTGVVLLVILALVLALGAAVVTAGPVRAQSMFSLQYLNVNPQQAHPGQPVNISINVANTGITRGYYTVVLMINGQQEEARTVTVDPLSTCPVNFLVTRDVPGTYDVTIGSQRSSFTILGAADISTGSPVSAPLIVAVVIGIVLIASLVLLFLHRRGFV